jgi:diphthamide synthase (EF-2-diphthine--ammonia ligase)
MRGLYPIWRKDTSLLIRTFLQLGFKAIVSCVDAAVLDSSFVGKVIDQDLLSRLPEKVDPCGENGEFHTFVSGGPIFAAPIESRVGESVLRDERFMYCDIL